ncbi:MAG: hypothetical protein ACREE0_01425, partial [Phenylobacterium sp.]
MTKVQLLLFQTPMWLLALSTFVALVAAYAVGSLIRHLRRPAATKAGDDENSYDGYIVSGVVGLLALLMSFTFGLAVDRFDTRRVMVLTESNAIGTTYLRAQTFPEPHRGALSRLLAKYVDVRLAAAQSTDAKEIVRLLGESDALQASLWTETIAAIAPQRDDVASSFMESMNETIDDAAARKAARMAHVPQRVFVVLFLYMLMTSGVMGYVIAERRRGAVVTLLLLLTVSYM